MKKVRSIKLVAVTAAIVAAMMTASAMPVFAAPAKMADGQTFDAEYYAANNPDVVKAFGTDANALYNHYLAYGKAEGRKPYAADTNTTATTGRTSSTVMTMPDGGKFDPIYYAANNPDVVKAFGTDANALYSHYLACGKAEGRLPYAPDTSTAAGTKTGRTQDAYTEEIISLVNQARVNTGVPALTETAILDKDAAARAVEAEQTHSHYRPDGTKWWTMDPDHMNGENLAWTNSTSASHVFHMWMNSEGHRENILDPSFHYIGVAYTINDATRRLTVVQNFGQ